MRHLMACSLGLLFCIACGDDGAPEEATSPGTEVETTGEVPGQAEQEGQAGQQDPQGTAVPIAPPDPNDPIGVEMVRRGAQFAANTEVSTPLFRGSLETGRFQDYQAVLRSDRCFKIIGVGGAGVIDLDLFLFDPQGTQLQEDTATDAYPVLGLNHPICPDLRGDYRVRVRMFEGSGEFGVQIFHSPSL